VTAAAQLTSALLLGVLVGLIVMLAGALVTVASKRTAAYGQMLMASSTVVVVCFVTMLVGM